MDILISRGTKLLCAIECKFPCVVWRTATSVRNSHELLSRMFSCRIVVNSYGDCFRVDGAAAEKHRLEEKQRAARKERKKSSGDWSPRLAAINNCLANQIKMCTLSIDDWFIASTGGFTRASTNTRGKRTGYLRTNTGKQNGRTALIYSSLRMEKYSVVLSSSRPSARRSLCCDVIGNYWTLDSRSLLSVAYRVCIKLFTCNLLSSTC